MKQTKSVGVDCQTPICKEQLCEREHPKVDAKRNVEFE
jgi:hypothetical protein